MSSAPDLRPIDALVEQIANLEKRVAKAERATPLTSAAIDSGELTVKDTDGNPVMTISAATGGGAQVTYPTGPTPATPGAPEVAAATGALAAAHTGTFTDPATGESTDAPVDLAHIQVHVRPATGLELVEGETEDTIDPDLLDDEDWEPGAGDLAAVLNPTPGAQTAVALPGGPYQVCLVAVTLSGQASAPSPVVTVDVPAASEDPELVAALAELDQRLIDAGAELEGAGERLDAAEQNITDAQQELDAQDNRISVAQQGVEDALAANALTDTKATAAASAASAAQSTADDAASAAAAAAGVAAGKGDVLIQAGTPAADMRKDTTLWIDTTGGANTPKRWNGTSWAAVTDKAATDAAAAAAAAQAAATAAQSAAGSAQTTANNALTMAGSKSRVYYSTAAPSGTGTAQGDLWRQIDTAKNVLAEWYWTGSAWQSSQITTTAIANLDVGKLTAGSGHLLEAVIDKLWAEVVKARKITTDMLLVGGDELVPDPYYDQGPLTYTGGEYSADAALPGHAQGLVLRANAAGSSNMSRYAPGVLASMRIPVQPGEVYEGYMWVYSTDGLTGLVDAGNGYSGVNLQIYGYNNATTQSGEDGTRPQIGYANSVQPTFPKGQWVKVGGQFTIPTGTTYIAPVPTLYFPKGATPFTGQVYIGRVSIRKAVGSTLIQDGAITTPKILAGAVTAETVTASEALSAKIGQFLQLDVGKLTVTGDTTLDTAVANAIWAKILTVRDVIADTINGRTITGALLQTLAAAARGVKISDELGISAYNSSGERTFYVDPSSGELTAVKGTFQGDITGSTIAGSTIRYNGAGSGAGYDVRIDADGSGSFLGFTVPGQVTEATVRAYSDDPSADRSTPVLVLRPPSTSAFPNRDALRLYAGKPGYNGLLDVVPHVYLRNELRGYTGSDFASIPINDIDGAVDAGAPSIRSRGLNRRTYSAAANVYVTSNGYMGRATSVRDAKLDIEDLPQEQIDALLSVKPRWWFDKGESERMADYLAAAHDPAVDTDPATVEDVPPAIRRIPGVVAEEVQEAGASAFVTYGDDGELTGVAYDRIGAVLLAEVAEQRDRLGAQAEQIQALTARLDALEGRNV